jgi:YD repeat-containing protein
MLRIVLWPAMPTVGTMLLLTPCLLGADSIDRTCPNHATMEMSYNVILDGRSGQTLKGSDGTTTLYQRRRINATSFEVVCRITDRRAHVVSNGVYRYQFKPSEIPGGNLVIIRLASVVDNEEQATTFDSRGRRLSITDGFATTRFAYDDAGRVTRKQTPGEVTLYTWDATSGNITSVDESSAHRRQKLTYTWTDGRKLTRAVSSDGHDIRLTYDAKGRISSLTDNGHQMTFTYNDRDKPVVILVADVGMITVTYDDAGEISKVDSTTGRTVALKVTSMFQELLDILRPAGVGINF